MTTFLSAGKQQGLSSHRSSFQAPATVHRAAPQRLPPIPDQRRGAFRRRRSCASLPGPAVVNLPGIHWTDRRRRPETINGCPGGEGAGCLQEHPKDSY